MNWFWLVFIIIFDVCLLLSNAGRTRIRSDSNFDDDTGEKDLLAHNIRLQTENSRLLAFLAVYENSKLQYKDTENNVEQIPFCNSEGMCKTTSLGKTLTKCEDTKFMRYCLENCLNSFIRCNKLSVAAFEKSRTSRYERRVVEDVFDLSECEKAKLDGRFPLPANCGQRKQLRKRTNAKRRKKRKKMKSNRHKTRSLIKSKPSSKPRAVKPDQPLEDDDDDDNDDKEEENDEDEKPKLKVGDKASPDVNNKDSEGKAESFFAGKAPAADSGIEATRLENNERTSVHQQGVAVEKALSSS